MKNLSKSEHNLNKIDKEITQIYYNQKIYNIGDVVTTTIAGYYKIVGFSSSRTMIVENILTSKFTKGSGKIDQFYCFSIIEKVSKEELIEQLEKCIETVEECF